MSKFKKAIDKISLDENDKRKMLNRILESKNDQQVINFRKLALSICTILLTFTITIGSSYALIKYFKLDEKIRELYYISDETAKQIEGNDINSIKEFDDMKIKIIQTITSENTLYV